jgi:RNA polymerase sigma-70 factor (ECF subfamily)
LAALTASDLTRRSSGHRAAGLKHRAVSSCSRRHNQRLYRATRAITRSDADAEDALQGAWLNVYRHLARFRGDAAFSTWARRIAVNEAIAQTRKR